MTRRTDPERLYQAARAGLFNRIIATGAIDELEAEHRIAAWEREADRRGIDRFSSGFWEDGGRWLDAQGDAGWP